jgi:hypothetical protein
MPADETCARGCCAVCCVLTHPASAGAGCRACAAVARRARITLEEESPRLFDSVVAALALTASRTGAPAVAVQNAFLIAAVRFSAPQRAITCAVNGYVRDALRITMTHKERFVFDSCADRATYAPLLAAPVGPFKMSNASFRLMLRRRMLLPILAPTSTKCVTVSWKQPKTCSLHGIAGGDADSHAESCKNGGCSVGCHNGMRGTVGGHSRTLGVPGTEESGDFLPPNRHLKVDTLHLTAGGAYCTPLAVDLTGRFGCDSDALRAAEITKEAKYCPHFTIPVCMRGFAYNNLGAFGPGAHDVVERIVREAARGGAGHVEDLSLEFYALLGKTFWRGMTERYAWFAAVNRDRSLTAPLPPTGRERVTGPRLQLRDDRRPPVARPHKRRADASARAPAAAATTPAGAAAGGHTAFTSAAGDGAAASRDSAAATGASGAAPAAGCANAGNAAAAGSQQHAGDAAAARSDSEALFPRDLVRLSRGTRHSHIFCPILSGALGLSGDPNIAALRALAPTHFDAACAELPHAWRQEGIPAADIAALRTELETNRFHAGEDTQLRFAWPTDCVLTPGPRSAAMTAVQEVLTAWYSRAPAPSRAAHGPPAETQGDARAGAPAPQHTPHDAAGSTEADDNMCCT